MRKFGVIVLLSLCWNLGAAALDPKLEATHNALRAVRDGLLDAINKNDIERQLSFLHTNVVVTWHNAEVSRGRDGVRAYYDRLTRGPQKMVDAFTAEVKVDELTALHGDNTGIAWGSSSEHFKLTNGRAFDLAGRWTVTLIRENDKWLIASLHVSSNVFDNAVVTMMKDRVMMLAIAVLLFGLLVGGFVGWRMRKPRAVA
ncbi:MAG TPA: nuclear transport factor 2 family protein [Verrucomicrobiae bacterium]|nr:nuclear transport factor 2 family protein [Verrucomicrobiae bacterium]